MSELSDHEVIAISAELQQRLPATPPDAVEWAVRDAVYALSGLDTASHHVTTLVRRRAEVMLEGSR